MRQDVRLIAAVGKHGQIGLRGKLPWQEEPADLAVHAGITEDGVLLMGWRTAARLNGRKLVNYGRSLALVSRGGLSLVDLDRETVDIPGDFLARPDRAMAAIAWHFPERTIWVAGGETIYGAFAPICERFHINLVDYDGPADCYLPALPWALGAS